MKVLLLTNSEIQKSSYVKNIDKICALTLLDIKKDSLTKVSSPDLVILLTNKVISRSSIDYKKTSLFIKRKKTKLIEVAFLKSNINQEKASSSAIIHGLGSMTWEAVEKIIRNN